jgi:NitT/TauT family transport system ATP-binding protein
MTVTEINHEIDHCGRTVNAPAVRLSGVTKAFGTGPAAVTALRDVDLEVRPGEFVCLLGASGCGKSTLLNLVAGLDKPTAGEVTLNTGRPSFMFQEPALLPWLDATRNVELPLRLSGVPRSRRRHRARELLELVRLDGQGAKRPHELSGGMRQRVALARALAHATPDHPRVARSNTASRPPEHGESPDSAPRVAGSGTASRPNEYRESSGLLLMDEPFAALDAITRDVLQSELLRVWRATGTTVLFVTHDVREALRLAQRVVLLSSRPGTVVAEWGVADGSPSATADQYDEITARLREVISRHAA